MLPLVMTCEKCKHRALEEEFRITQPKHICPKCKSEDVFPTRWFSCNFCFREGEQSIFFGSEIDLENHPVDDLDEKAVCPNTFCPSYHSGEHTEVTEIPVPGFIAA